jgi:diguanylate cyclase (GGDEF)-like protein
LNDPTKFSSLRSALAVPLQADSGVVAVLALYRVQQNAFAKEDLRIVLNASSKLGFTIANALKFKKAEDSATTDFLTGLPNASSLYLHLESELSRCKRSGSPLTVFMLDLDGFKQVNDRFGHMEGNNLLRMFAAALKGSCRGYDYAARVGGDEFVVISPGLGPEGTAEMIERLQKTAIQAGNGIFAQDILSVSVGNASYPSDGDNVEDLLTRADHEMYRMKALRHATA